MGKKNNSKSGGGEEGGGNNANPEESKRLAQERRNNIRSYIHNERDTILRKWQCLQESLNSEEKRKEEFMKRQEVIKTRSIPPIVQKFIRTLKRSIRTIITNKGGTPYSIVRSMFLYWDRDKSGELGVDELKLCMTSLGVKISDEDIQQIIQYYDSKKGNNEMAYNRLLADIQYDEPSIITILDPIEFKNDSGRDEDRFQTQSDEYSVMPPLVEQFIAAVRSVLSEKMRVEGGTELSHLRHAFLMFDHDYSSALDVEELTLAMHRNLGLTITPQQAIAVVNYYDRKKTGQMSYQLLLEDVLRGQPLMLQHPELTSRTIAQKRNNLKTNPFIPKPFQPTQNKKIENIKIQILKELESRIRYQGGSMKSWLTRAFMAWDTQSAGTINNWRDLQGVIRKLGVNITEDDANAIIHCYDKHSNNKMDYNLFIDDLIRSDPFYVVDANANSSQSATTFSSSNLTSTSSLTATGRTPLHISNIIKKIRKAVEIYHRKSDGSIEPKDLLNGTFLRFDSSRTGKISITDLAQVTRELRIPLSNDEMRQITLWYDSNGSERLNFSMLVSQLYGDDILTRPLSLPSLSSTLGKSSTLGSTTGSNGDDRHEVKQSLKQLAAQKLQRKKLIIAEKVKVQAKLESIEKQRQALLDNKRLSAATASRNH